jgi:hypothetical protein
MPCASSPFDDLVSWWHADQNTTSGNEQDVLQLNHGMAVGSAQFTAAAQGKGYDFDGTWYVQVPDAASLDLVSEISIDAWIQPAGPGPIVTKISDGGSDGFGLELVGSALSFRVGSHVVSGGSLQLGQLVHVAATYDGAALRLYVNGAEVGSAPVSVNIPSNALPLRIGADAGPNRFDGLIDEVRVWKAGLSASQVAAQHAGTTCAVVDPVRWNFVGAPISKPGCSAALAQAAASYALPGFAGYFTHTASGCDTGGNPFTTNFLGPSVFPYAAFTIGAPFELKELRFADYTNPGSPYDIDVEISPPNAPAPDGAGFTLVTTLSLQNGTHVQGPFPVGVLAPGTYFLRWRPTAAVSPGTAQFALYSLNLIGDVP